jgi:hypothetical protein
MLRSDNPKGAGRNPPERVRSRPTQVRGLFVSTYSEAALEELGRVKDADFDEAVAALGRTKLGPG